MYLHAVIIICLLFGASACTSNAHRTDSVKVEGVPVFATDATGENFIRLDSGESGKTQNEVPNRNSDRLPYSKKNLLLGR